MATITSPVSIRELAQEALLDAQARAEQRAREIEAERRQKLNDAYSEIIIALDQLLGIDFQAIRADLGDYTDHVVAILAELPHLSWELKRDDWDNVRYLYVHFRDAQGAERRSWVRSLADLGAILEQHPGSK